MQGQSAQRGDVSIAEAGATRARSAVKVGAPSPIIAWDSWATASERADFRSERDTSSWRPVGIRIHFRLARPSPVLLPSPVQHTQASSLSQSMVPKYLLTLVPSAVARPRQARVPALSRFLISNVAMERGPLASTRASGARAARAERERDWLRFPSAPGSCSAQKQRSELVCEQRRHIREGREGEVSG